MAVNGGVGPRIGRACRSSRTKTCISDDHLAVLGVIGSCRNGSVITIRHNPNRCERKKWVRRRKPRTCAGANLTRECFSRDGNIVRHRDSGHSGIARMEGNSMQQAAEIKRAIHQRTFHWLYRRKSTKFTPVGSTGCKPEPRPYLQKSALPTALEVPTRT